MSPQQTLDLKAKWPQERTLSRYEELVSTNLRQFLKNGGTWVDIGCGKGVALSELIDECHVNLVGVTPVPIDVDGKIKQVLGLVPSDRSMLTAYRGQTRLTSDIFGGLSYCEDPLEALIYEALLLQNDGMAIIATRTERFGETKETQKRITSFFEKNLGYQIDFNQIQTISDATKKPVDVLQIKIIAKNTHPKQSFDELLLRSRSEVGVPHKERPAWTSEDGKAQIWQVEYRLNLH